MPTIMAAIEIQHGNPEKAIEILGPDNRYENSEGYYWTKYLRGQAYLKLKDGVNAASAFQKILDNRGQDPLSPLYPLSYLGKARAAKLSGNMEESIKNYDKFLDIMKDADDDLPIINEAKAEYTKLLNNESIQ